MKFTTIMKFTKEDCVEFANRIRNALIARGHSVPEIHSTEFNYADIRDVDGCYHAKCTVLIRKDGIMVAQVDNLECGRHGRTYRLRQHKCNIHDIVDHIEGVIEEEAQYTKRINDQQTRKVAAKIVASKINYDFNIRSIKDSSDAYYGSVKAIADDYGNLRLQLDKTLNEEQIRKLMTCAQELGIIDTNK